METLPNICPGYGLYSIPSDSEFSLMVSLDGVENESIDFTESKSDTYRISSFWMNTGNFDFDITVVRGSDADDSMSIRFQAEFVLTFYMI